MNLHPNCVKILISAGIALSVSACQTQQPAPNITLEELNQAPLPEQEPVKKAESELSADLLYDLLVAAIASQRNKPEVALESLSRAAYQSRDRRLIAEALQFAMDIGDYHQSIELAQLLTRLEPNNHRVILSLAEAQFKIEEYQSAINLLASLARNQTSHDVHILQDIATLLSRQDPETVLTDFLEYVDNSPDNEHITLTAALLAARLNNSDEILRLLDRTLELKPDWEIPGILKLTELSGKDINGLHDFAIQQLDKYPDQERFQLQYARILIQQGDIDSAVKHLESILKLNSDSVDALFTIGVIYLDKGFLEKAEKPLTRYLELNPTNDQSRLYLADIAFQQKNYSTAVQHLRGVSSQRYYLDAQLKMARIIAERDNLETALKHLQQIETFNDDENTRIILEQDILFRDRNLLDRSKMVLDEGLQLFPDNPDLLYNRGLLAAQMELLELHERDMRRLIELEPENAHAYNALGYTLADQTDRLDEAMTLIVKANTLLPDNPFILDSMGWIHFRLGNNEQAIKLLRQALDIMQDAEIAAHLGEVLWTYGNKDEAVKIWKQGTEWGPENTILKETIQRFSQQQQSGNHLSSNSQTSIAGADNSHFPVALISTTNSGEPLITTG